ncbi:STAS domain-containing protein [Streptomyces sp. NPDC005899]|uniref:STAS domain-containing protein n=1 Tax=Streptomyces sp. NPDC005899 TaxID=3155716 RepID=UPI0033E0B325
MEAGPGAARLRLTGDLDHDTSDQFVERAQACLAADPGLRDLFLDCAGLRVCDSTGVAGLLLLHRGTSARGIGLHLESPPASLRRTLDVTGIARIFTQGGGGRQAEPATDSHSTAEARHQTSPPPAPSR